MREGTERELFSGGHLACQGCGAAIAMRLALSALGENTVVVIPASCFSVICGPYPYSALRVPVYHTAFETAAATATGLRAGLDATGRKDAHVLAFAGDGGTFDIGLQALSGAAERNERIIYACYDNEAYMNTGIQRSSATPWGAWTTTTPVGRLKKRPKKDIVKIMAGHRIPYVATATPAFPDDFREKFRKAAETEGTAFIHILSPCPPGWKFPSNETIRLSRLAVETRVFPLLEIFDGEEVHITYEPKGLDVTEYLSRQGRFSALTEEEVDHIRKSVEKSWKSLLTEALWHGF
ncbi:MAG: pyruvate synthase subunit beta [Deltaproteobacteria bacterium]|nr:MAG: pyruvate synthase subunit beta [Deltaproteobacteria bacterium]